MHGGVETGVICKNGGERMEDEDYEGVKANVSSVFKYIGLSPRKHEVATSCNQLQPDKATAVCSPHWLQLWLQTF